jgi:hypothetical protein
LAVCAVSTHEARADLFAPPDAVPMTGDLQAVPLALGEYSGGGGADVLLGTLSGAALGILPGDGLGGFGSPEPLNRGGAGWAPVDVNRDGLADLATVADLSPERPMAALVMLADGDGGIAAPTETDISTSRDDKQGALFGDFDGDGKVDVVVATRPSGGGTTTLHLARGDGTGGFGAETTQELTGSALSLVHAVDLNADRRDDLVAYRDSGLVTYLADATGSFSAAGSTSLPQSLQPPTGAASADFDGDGREDVALTGYSCLVTLLGDGAGGLATEPCTTDGSSTSPYHPELAVGDLDGDGLPDLVSGDIWDGAGTSWFAVYLADGAGGLYYWDRFACAKEAFACEYPVVGDLDGDQRADVVLGGSTSKVFVFRNTGRPKATLLAPNGTDFGEWPVGERSDALVVAVVNDGERPFDVTSAGLTGASTADFRIVDTDCPGLPLLGREFCGYLIDFKPAAIGPRGAVLTIHHTAPGGVAAIQLSGRGGQPDSGVPPKTTPPPTIPPPVSPPIIAPALTERQLLAALRPPRAIHVPRRARRVTVGHLANPPVQSASLRLMTVAGKPHATRRATVEIARGRLAIAPGHQRAATLKVTRRGRKLLRRARSVRATLIVDALDANHHPVRATKRIILRVRPPRR